VRHKQTLSIKAAPYRHKENEPLYALGADQSRLIVWVKPFIDQAAFYSLTPDRIDYCQPVLLRMTREQ